MLETYGGGVEIFMPDRQTEETAKGFFLSPGVRWRRRRILPKIQTQRERQNNLWFLWGERVKMYILFTQKKWATDCNNPESIRPYSNSQANPFSLSVSP